MEDSKATGNTRVHEEARLAALEHLTIPLEKQVEWAQTVPDDLRGLKVLVVDDSSSNRAILHQQLTSWGMSNYVGEDGAQALEMLRSAAEAGEPYELAIIDMQMPEMDGYEATAEIRRREEGGVVRCPVDLLRVLGQVVPHTVR